MSRTAEVFVYCTNGLCPDYRLIYTAKIETTPEGTFFLDETDHCPTCGQPGERDDD